MAQAKKGKESKLWTKAKWKGFVNANLNQQEKKQVKENLLAEATGFESLMNAATAGYKCSISYSIPEDTYTMSLTGQYQQRPNAGITMSMRHKELIVAISAMDWCLKEAGELGSWEERFGSIGSDDW